MIVFLLANAYEDGQKTMENAWNIMENNFWDENAGLYKVDSDTNRDIRYQ